MHLYAADHFCGAGGLSTGLVQAAIEHGYITEKINLVAVNHWRTAVSTHEMNHPWARHYCADLGTLDPNKAIPGGRLDILVGSPECTHHSVARGGKPCSDQSRASAWHMLHWAERLHINHILIENVREFQDWGPLDANGRPDKARKGHTFDAFLNALDAMGYHVDHQVQNAADHGEATSRKRLFIQAWRNKKPTWPNPTHVGRWRGAQEIIDWSLPGNPISQRKKPLSANTMKRIEYGLRKFGGQAFLAVLNGTRASVLSSTARSLGEPLPTQTVAGHFALCQPFIIQTDQTGSNGGCFHSLDKPIGTIVTKQNMALIEPFLVEFHNGKGSDRRTRSLKEPLPTQDTSNRFGLCEPFLTKYYGTGTANSVKDPLDAITTRDRFALVQPEKSSRGMDIRFRMLQPHELAAAMGFIDYKFTGTKEQVVRQIGNAVSVATAKALCLNILRNVA